MSIFLSQDNLNTIIELPVMPERITFSNGTQNQTYHSSALGEINWLTGDALEGISFNSWFPGEGEKTGLTNYRTVNSPKSYIDAIKAMKKSNVETRLVITELDISMPVSIETFEYSQIGGSGGEYEYSMAFKEYRAFDVTEVKSITIRLNDIAEEVEEVASISNVDRPDEKQPPQTHIVVSGESLWLIAKKNLNDGSKYNEIAQLNDITEPYLIFPGQELVMPT